MKNTMVIQQFLGFDDMHLLLFARCFTKMVIVVKMIETKVIFTPRASNKLVFFTRRASSYHNVKTVVNRMCKIFPLFEIPTFIPSISNHGMVSWAVELVVYQ